MFGIHEYKFMFYYNHSYLIILLSKDCFKSVDALLRNNAISA